MGFGLYIYDGSIILYLILSHISLSLSRSFALSLSLSRLILLLLLLLFQARLLDCRNAASCSKTWTFDAEVEKVAFDPFSPWNFYAATEDGNLFAVDVRQQRPLFTLAAHSDAITALSFSPKVRGAMVEPAPITGVTKRSSLLD